MLGIVVGSDQNQEWMLPWWWERYTRYNTFPVCFFNFGMSKQAIQWCQERGTLLCLAKHSAVCSKEQISKNRLKKWTQIYDKGIWVARESWFQKPQAMEQSPFTKSIWIDLDCEIRGDLTPLFSYTPFAAAKDIGSKGVNSGVVVFEKNHPLLAKWVYLSQKRSDLFCSDQEVLNHLIRTSPIKILPQIYNWRACLGENSKTVILHWAGFMGKEMIHLMQQHAKNAKL